MPFSYKTVLITGASAGIGQALVDKFIAELGDRVFIIAAGRRQDRLDALVAKHGASRIATEAVDVADLAGLPAWIQSVTAKYPTLDCVIFNAGFQQGLDFVSPQSMSLEDVTTEMTTNYLSPVHATALLIPHFEKLSAASLIYVTSGLSLIPIQRCPNYCASKAALHSFAWTLRSQLEGAAATQHIRVTEIVPPAVQTELHTRQGLPAMGMPLADFIQETWDGLSADEVADEVMPAQLRAQAGTVDDVKRAAYKEFNEKVKAAMAAAKANAGQ